MATKQLSVEVARLDLFLRIRKKLKEMRHKEVEECEFVLYSWSQGNPWHMENGNLMHKKRNKNNENKGTNQAKDQQIYIFILVVKEVG